MVATQPAASRSHRPTPAAAPRSADRINATIAVLAVVAIALHLGLRFLVGASPTVANVPLYAALALGGVPLVVGLLRQMWALEFGSDLLAGISIVTSVLLGEYLAGTFVVLMLSGGGALESYAVRSAPRCSKRWPNACRRSRTCDVTAGWSTWPWTTWRSATACWCCRMKSARSTAW